jgi:hypothetical protein
MVTDQSCIIDGCTGVRGQKGTARKMCRPHYLEYQRSQPHKQCLVPDCTLSANWPGSGRGLCSKHRYREDKHGTTDASGLTRAPDGLSIKERFESKVKIDPVTGCHVWQDKASEKGYGWLCINKKALAAHRVAWTLYVGEVPRGLVLDHLCENTMCVNVKHLEPVTRAENVRRGWFRPLELRIPGIVYTERRISPL